MKQLYIEAFSGLSGDMLFSALCSLADYYEEIIKLPARLHLPDGKVEVNTVTKNGIVCQHVHIIDLNLDTSEEPSGDQTEHTHDGHTHSHQHEHHHHHDHAHSHQHHHSHRHLKDILRIIDQGHITDGAKEIAKEIFTIIGRSEARIHNMDLDEIHFHEVSGVDSILDIVGSAVVLDHLKIEKTYCTPVCTGYGMVKTQHGLLPVPAPATADLLSGMPTYAGEEKGERVTPTGAAILRFLQPSFDIPDLITERIAYGPGQKNFIGPNVVRLSFVRPVKKKPPVSL
ncbi:MAG: LarC family nickel insertion protein [Saprospiraceae bacterium]|nr:LarC family nickel insertion protein [Saprospiraceae bacterium]